MKKKDFIILIIFSALFLIIVESTESGKPLIPEKKEVLTLIDSDVYENTINIDFFTSENLIAIKGIGKKLAELIIDFIKSGQLKKLDDLKKIRGIGEKKYILIKEAYEKSVEN